MKIPPNKGYLVFPKVVPEHLCQDVINDIESHTEGGQYAVSYGGLTELYHAQSMWDIRQLPEVYELFTAVLDIEDLWVSLDRVCRKAPILIGEVGAYSSESFIHWDENPNENPHPFKVQGVIALSDTTEEMGGFQCLPSFYQNFDGYISSQPNEKINQSHFYTCKDIAYIGNESYSIEKVPMNTGDLLIFDSMLPHGNGNNFSDNIRYCQYLTMFPVGDERLRKERIRCWENNLPPSGWAFPGDPRELETKNPSAQLSYLGRRLLGLDNWPKHKMNGVWDDAYAAIHD